MNVKLKRLSEKELDLMMQWRMREDIDQMMLTHAELTMEGQYKWYEKLKEDKSQIRWVIYYDEIPIGSFYITDIDSDNKRCESGWFIAKKEYRSLKLAMDLQANSFDYIFDVLGLNKIFGNVIDINKPLLRVLKMVGIEVEGLLKQHVIRDGKFHDVYVVGITKDEWNEKKNIVKYSICHME